MDDPSKAHGVYGQEKMAGTSEMYYTASDLYLEGPDLILNKVLFLWLPFLMYAFMCLHDYRFADLFLLYHTYAFTVT
jgi:hypothetical protein